MARFDENHPLVAILTGSLDRFRVRRGVPAFLQYFHVSLRTLGDERKQLPVKFFQFLVHHSSLLLLKVSSLISDSLGRSDILFRPKWRRNSSVVP